MNWQDFLSFRRMITPLIIQILFWLGVVISVIAGIVTLVSGFASGFSRSGGAGGILGGVCLGPVVILLGILFSRTCAELLILIFRMNETLTDIKDALQKKN